ncbi:hypothetical protein A374_04814 [Fictibacillus macauensis ZFHKF-1]|uniref:DUF378 domain-containing protein n=1 Tax=Fictibacillus macauensis ZFHKF-1 TaxID=1196324 RepID=I8ALR4_9BACL|nr:DUF378 domain-containing protein [Fictibacillus macauensis]EIT86867.1 hypothetical protein A374_04814 [Fictibacillus macauensis ZFHKF-1]
MAILKHLAMLLAVIGTLNWGVVGIFDYNVVNELFGSSSITAEIIYILVGLSGLYLLANWIKGD